MNVHKGDMVIISYGGHEHRAKVASIDDDLIYFDYKGTRICGTRKNIVKIVSSANGHFPKRREV